jgi:diacylglycerol kinase family enzyme
MRVSVLDLRLEAVVDGLQSAEAEIEFRETTLASLHSTTGAQQGIAAAVDALAAASNNGPAGRVATALKRFVVYFWL